MEQGAILKKVYAVVKDHHTKKYIIAEYAIISTEGDYLNVELTYPVKNTYSYTFRNSSVFTSKKKAIEHESDKLLKELETAKRNVEKFIEDIFGL